jgi:hypothetical protein
MMKNYLMMKNFTNPIPSQTEYTDQARKYENRAEGMHNFGRETRRTEVLRTGLIRLRTERRGAAL